MIGKPTVFCLHCRLKITSHWPVTGTNSETAHHNFCCFLKFFSRFPSTTVYSLLVSLKNATPLPECQWHWLLLIWVSWDFSCSRGDIDRGGEGERGRGFFLPTFTCTLDVWTWLCLLSLVQTYLTHIMPCGTRYPQGCLPNCTYSKYSAYLKSITQNSTSRANNLRSRITTFMSGNALKMEFRRIEGQ